jgi:4-aminobutyrate aminotransferase-like enzyme
MERLADARRRLIGPSVRLSYRKPLEIVRGRGAYLFDATGRGYLDLVNNVCHVGHAHPRVVEAAARQMAELNTNTRYLHRGIVEYAARLVARLPPPLEVCYFVCSGSEANDLALRLARAATGRRGVIVVDRAYHGNLTSLIDLSPYKLAGPGGYAVPAHVAVVPCPDAYRGPYRGPYRSPNRGGASDLGSRYAVHVSTAAALLEQRGAPAAAFLCESLLGCGGQIEPPPGYLSEAYGRARRAGAVVVADEVQVGFGRVGDAFWGFELQRAVPDVVTLGKPIGNGHPMAAVVTTPRIAAAFDNGMEYFNTFGGNPVSAAVGLAVLDVIEAEGLQENAAVVGAALIEGLEGLARRHPLVGDVRGRGLFLGVELVEDRRTLEPAARAAEAVVESMKRRGFLLSTDGPAHNVLKIKPPLVIARADAERFLEALDRTLAEVALAPLEARPPRSRKG